MPNLLQHSRITPFAHQVVGIQALVDHPVFALFDEMGAGKSKQVIDAAYSLFVSKKIERVIIVCPASVRSVWYDQELGELFKHAWRDIPIKVMEYHAKSRGWSVYTRTVDMPSHLEFIITNYDFIGRSKRRLDTLLPFCGPTTWLVLDESTAVKNWRAKQTQACVALRQRCGRVTLLSGTPIANNPLDMFSQGNVMDPAILDCRSRYTSGRYSRPYITYFRDRYCEMAPNTTFPKIVAWKNLPDLQRRFAPYVLRRLKKDCLDLPPKLDAVALGATLTDETWKLYKEMKTEMIAWLNSGTVSTASLAIVRIMRLAQLTSGFLGGLEKADTLDFDEPLLNVDGRPEWVPTVHPPEMTRDNGSPIREVGREKLDVFLFWLRERLDEDPNFKLLVWCRFRPELQRLMRELEGLEWSGLSLGEIRGGQTRDDRNRAIRLLDPRTAPSGPVVVAGTPSSGAMGLNLTDASSVFYLSNDYSLKTRLQSEDRVHRPGQTHAVSYFDIVATGPHGQKTIDHAILGALKAKQNLAEFTTDAWVQALEYE